VKLGSQDLGTGTRTCIQIVAAESLGLPFDAVKVEIGDTRYPVSAGREAARRSAAFLPRRAAVRSMR